jgi:hypothetical protein
VTRHISIDDVEKSFSDMTSGHGAPSAVCFAGRGP